MTRTASITLTRIKDGADAYSVRLTPEVLELNTTPEGAAIIPSDNGVSVTVYKGANPIGGDYELEAVGAPDGCAPKLYTGGRKVGVQAVSGQDIWGGNTVSVGSGGFDFIIKPKNAPGISITARLTFRISLRGFWSEFKQRDAEITARVQALDNTMGSEIKQTAGGISAWVKNKLGGAGIDIEQNKITLTGENITAQNEANNPILYVENGSVYIRQANFLGLMRRQMVEVTTQNIRQHFEDGDTEDGVFFPFSQPRFERCLTMFRLMPGCFDLPPVNTQQEVPMRLYLPEFEFGEWVDDTYNNEEAQKRVALCRSLVGNRVTIYNDSGKDIEVYGHIKISRAVSLPAKPNMMRAAASGGTYDPAKDPTALTDSGYISPTTPPDDDYYRVTDYTDLRQWTIRTGEAVTLECVLQFSDYNEGFLYKGNFRGSRERVLWTMEKGVSYPQNPIT